MLLMLRLTPGAMLPNLRVAKIESISFKLRVKLWPKIVIGFGGIKAVGVENYAGFFFGWVGWGVGKGCLGGGSGDRLQL